MSACSAGNRLELVAARLVACGLGQSERLHIVNDAKADAESIAKTAKRESRELGKVDKALAFKTVDEFEKNELFKSAKTKKAEAKFSDRFR